MDIIGEAQTTVRDIRAQPSSPPREIKQRRNNGKHISPKIRAHFLQNFG
jgi:hypothetical protein